MSRVGFVVHEGRGPAVSAAADLREGLAGDGIDLLTLAGAPPGELDLVVSVGGDGTFLRGAHAAAAAGCPVLGVKVGRLGFLTEVEPEAALGLIRRALRGDVTIEERMAVVGEPVAGAAFASQWALNEVMVEKRARHRLVRLAVIVDGGYVTTFSADGVVVATPTGSTAYSFSARGPIVSPDVPCLIVTPVAVHMVFDRSFVLNHRQVVELEVIGDEAGLLSADGRESIELPVGARVRIAAADRPARLVRRDDAPPFLTRVREKFDLPGVHGDVADED